MRPGPDPLVESVVRATRPMSRATDFAMRVPPLPKGKKPACWLSIDYYVLLLTELDGEEKVLFQSGIQDVMTPRCLGRSFPCHANENSRSAFISCCRRKACFRFSGIKGVVQGC